MRHYVLLSAALASALPQSAWARDGGVARPAESRDPAALECLTQAIYYEARNQSADGQRAVAQVVLNRTRHPSYPGSVCGVVFQGSERTTGCQFSFTCDGSMNAGVNDGRAWDRAERIAAAALSGSVYRPVGQALNYHTTAIMPYWAPSLVQQAVVGDHIFYRRPNSALETYSSQPQIERPAEREWTSRDSATLRRTLRTRPALRLQNVGMAIMEIPIEEQPVRFRALGGRSSVQAERTPRRRAAAPQRSGPRMAIEGGVRVSRGS
jgi:Cell Wall Hydrolase